MFRGSPEADEAPLFHQESPLRLALDLRIYGRRGIGRYNEALYRGLAARGDRLAITAFSGKPLAAVSEMRVLRIPGYVGQEQVELPLRVEKGVFDVVHFTANTAPALRWRRPPTVVTVHDVLYLRSPREVPLSPSMRQTLGRAYRFAAFHTGTRRCDHLIAVSQQTANELRRLFADDLPPISVVHSAVDPTFTARANPDDLARVSNQFGLESGHFFLHPGAVDPRKNTSVVLRAFARYRAMGGAADLAVMGLSRAAIALFSTRSSSRDAVHLLPFVPNETAVALVKAARGVIFVPSAEGFGYPLVEAMAAGTPVIASSIAVLRELSEGAALEVPPEEIEPLAVAMRAIDLRDPRVEALRRQGIKRARHFTAENMAEGTIQAYASVSKRAPVRSAC